MTYLPSAQLAETRPAANDPLRTLHSRPSPALVALEGYYAMAFWTRAFALACAICLLSALVAKHLFHVPDANAVQVVLWPLFLTTLSVDFFLRNRAAKHN